MKLKPPGVRLVGRCLFLLLVASCMMVPCSVGLAGTWTALANTPSGGVGTMMLLSDGTVMAQTGGSAWARLAPDSSGSYVNGTWTNMASMNYTRLYYASAVLQDGRVFIAGGEYGTGTTNAEVYNPLNNTWTIIPVPAGLINKNNTIGGSGENTAGFSDSGCKILANGKVLILPVHPFTSGRTVLFDPVSNTLSLGPALFRGVYQDEASWVKLPDNSIITIDPFGTLTERYIPASNTFINDGTVPVSLYDPFGSELGPAFLLPNGKAIFFGSLPHTAIYTPSGSASPGTWVAGPDYPNNQGMPDAPGTMMVNGKILLATSPTPTSANHFPTNTSFYEFDYSAGALGTFTQVGSPCCPGGLVENGSTYPTRMLALPDGKVLFSNSGSQCYAYTPSGSPLAAGKPVITGLSQNLNGSFHLTGIRLNGISEGSNYGDDVQMDSNYPLVRLSSGGSVYYCRTHDWSSTSVQNPNSVSTEFDVPRSLGPGFYSLVVVANGIASDPITFSGAVWVDFNYGGFFQFGTFDFPYKTLAGGTNAVASGGLIDIKAGSSTEIMTITKPMEIHAVGGPAIIGIGH